MTTTEESDQVVQRRANLEELRRLGVDPYPHRFDPQGAVEEIVQGHGACCALAPRAPLHRPVRAIYEPFFFCSNKKDLLNRKK